MRTTTYVQHMSATHQQVVDRYLQELKLKGHDISNPQMSLRIFFDYVHRNDIDYRYFKIAEAQEFQTYLGSLNKPGSSVYYARGTIVGITGCVSSFYRYLKHRGQSPANPFDEIVRVKRNKALPRNIPNEEEMHRLLQYLRTFWKGKHLRERKRYYKAHVLAEVLYATGARITEIVRLKVSDIDFYRGVIHITDSKTNEAREALLGSYAEKVLKLYVERMREQVMFGKNNAETSLLFGSKNNVRTLFNQVLQQAGKELGLGHLTSHMFRHAVGCHLLRNGCDLRFIQDILGHKDLHSTQMYTRVDKEDLKHILDAYHPRVFKKVQAPTEEEAVAS